MVNINYFQGRNKDTHVENKHVDTARKRGGWDELESSIDVCILPCVR